MKLHFFDLDGTVADSSHRCVTRPDGSLDLDHWRENSTPALIAKDKTLPLADRWRQKWAESNQPGSFIEIIGLTARVMDDADFMWLLNNGLYFHNMLSRPEGLRFPDSMLKEALLRLHCQDRGWTWARFCADSIVYEDNTENIDVLSSIGLRVLDAGLMNRIWANRALRLA